MYSLRVRYIDEPVETVCAPWTPAVAPDIASIAFSDPVTDETNTIYIADTARYDATYGVGATDAVRAETFKLNGTGDVDGRTIQGAMLSVDDDERVSAARAALDVNPCSMAAREGLTAAINTAVSELLGEHADQIRSIVIVGGDDIIPFAPVAQQTSQFTERSHASELRLTQLPDGTPCPAEVAEGTLDRCATPLSAAAAASFVLTDDPYGLASAYETLGGYLYVPRVALGRLVETPQDVADTIQRFVDAKGILDADSSVTGGYGAWSELPDLVTSSLAWRSGANQRLGSGDPAGLWDAGEITDALFPADGDGPKVVSINAHADERRMLPGIEGADAGRFDDTDLFTTDAVTDAGALAGSLVFLIGCHAGNNLPSAYYGDGARDWVDVFSKAGGFVGNTGYGLANNVTTALSEQLLALYAGWIGVAVDGHRISASQALTYAKQSYLGGLGLYSGYDEKALMESVYYGLPMYTFADAGNAKQAPIPEIPATLGELKPPAGDNPLATASLSLSPQFETRTVRDPAGVDASYLTADGQGPAVVAGQPILPKIVSRLRDEGDLTPRGVIITGLASTTQSNLTPAIAEPDVGVATTASDRTGVAFPSTFATITRQETPDGPADFLVVTPGRVQAPQGSAEGTGSLERFTRLDLDIVYAQPGMTDTTSPVVSAIETSGDSFRFAVDGTGSSMARGILLVQFEGESEWQAIDVAFSSGSGSAPLPSDPRPYRWILQVADLSGNVAVESQRGQLVTKNAAPPELGDVGADESIAVGESLRRTVEVVGDATDDQLTGRVTVASGGAQVASSTATIQTGDDGKARATIVQPFTSPGDYTVALEVCRDTACTRAEFAVHVPQPNSAPTASVTLSSNTTSVGPTSVLTAEATGSDPDDDPVTLAYEWTRNGAPLPGEDAATLTLLPLEAAPGDVFRVTVTPSDPQTAGHAAFAEATVATPLPAPQIAAEATNAEGPYGEGEWSTTPVTVSFICSGVGILCSPPQTIASDTSAAGVVVKGTVEDLLGRTSSVDFVVRLDATAPRARPRRVAEPRPTGRLGDRDSERDGRLLRGEGAAVRRSSDGGAGPIDRGVFRERLRGQFHERRRAVRGAGAGCPHVPGSPGSDGARPPERRRLERVPAHVGRADRIPCLRRKGQVDREEGICQERDAGRDDIAAEEREGQRDLDSPDPRLHLRQGRRPVVRADLDGPARKRQEVHLQRAARRRDIVQDHLRSAMTTAPRADGPRPDPAPAGACQRQ